VRRSNGFQFLSLILACLGSASWSSAVDLGTETSWFASIALWLTAAGCAVFSMKANRRDRSNLVRHLRQAAMAIRPGQADCNAKSIEAETFSAAVDNLVATSRAQTMEEAARIRELEMSLKAVSLERDRAAAMVNELSNAVRNASGAVAPSGALNAVAQAPATPQVFGGGIGQPPAMKYDDSEDVAAGLAREVLRMKRDFISMVSHELRTPLASIKAYTEMLIDDEAVDAHSQREFYTVISTEAARLGQAIDNVLSLSRLEAGLITPVFSSADLNQVVREAVEAVNGMAESKNLNMQVQLAPGAKADHCDRGMLAQAVTNLVSNAVKFTPISGSVTVRTAMDPHRGTVTLEVEDTGAGIAPKDYAVFFDRSYSSDTEMGKRGGPGSGVGLVLAQQVVESVHGGKMIVHSDPGKGSTVGFELQAAHVDTESNKPANAPVEPEAGLRTKR
jgi:signal transduction histidine kinase